MKIILLALWISYGLGLASHAADFLKYEPSVVTLRGKLLLQEFPGPPGYENIAHGDKREGIWILKLYKPVRVIALPGDELMESQDDVKEIQLVCLTGCKEKYSFYAGKTVKLSGTLFSAHSGHHHKNVLMTVNRREE